MITIELEYKDGILLGIDANFGDLTDLPNCTPPEEVSDFVQKMIALTLSPL
jgi:hypothetical protein